MSRLLQADGRRAERLRAIREEFCVTNPLPQGHHEDFRYLNELPLTEADGTAKVDDLDLLRYVPDGTVLEARSLRILIIEAFLGGIETDDTDSRSIDTHAYEKLMDMGPGSLDILATHDPPYGVGVGYRGQVAGSRLVTALIEHTQPALHISGHVHHLNGPRSYGRTWSWSLDGLISSVSVAPGRQRVRDGVSCGSGYRHLVPAADHGALAARVRHQGFRLRLVVRVLCAEIERLRTL